MDNWVPKRIKRRKEEETEEEEVIRKRRRERTRERNREEEERELLTARFLTTMERGLLSMGQSSVLPE